MSKFLWLFLFRQFMNDNVEGGSSTKKRLTAIYFGGLKY